MATRRSVERKGVRPVFALLPLSVPLVLAAATLSFSSSDTVPVEFPSIRYDRVAAENLPLRNHAVLLPVQAGDTLDQLVQSAGVPREDALELVSELSRHVNPRKIKSGEFVRIEYGSDDTLRGIGLTAGSEGRIDAVVVDGRFDVRFTPAIKTKEAISVAGRIESSFYDALQQSGESPALAAQLVEIFAWDVDFFRLRKGDWFSVIAEKQYSDGVFTGYGPITGAQFHHNGQTYEAFRFVDASGTPGYYTPSGAPLRKQFLRSPLKFSRITSGYTNRRFHPVLKIFRAHPGIDYGAPVGTPVMVTADGVVVSASHGRGEGNMVRVRHANGMESYYLHLSRFAKGIRAGARVHQGQVIAYVGKTGLATGPHLDYRMKRNGQFVNPLQIKVAPAEPLTGAALAAFKAEAARIRPQLPSPDTQTAAAKTVATPPSM
jgi:murein DD-endopeptidase MepM/ murein hydrolase activator NlpD